MNPDNDEEVDEASSSTSTSKVVPVPPPEDGSKEEQAEQVQAKEDNEIAEKRSQKKSLGQKIFGFASQRKDSIADDDGGFRRRRNHMGGTGSAKSVSKARVMTKEERMALQAKEIAAFKKMDEAMDVESGLDPCKTKTLKFMDHPTTEVFMMVLTIFAL